MRQDRNTGRDTSVTKEEENPILKMTDAQLTECIRDPEAARKILEAFRKAEIEEVGYPKPSRE